MKIAPSRYWDDWMPIETAPTDGSEILLQVEGVQFFGWWDADLGGWTRDGERICHPEYWRL